MSCFDGEGKEVAQIIFKNAAIYWVQAAAEPGGAKLDGRLTSRTHVSSAWMRRMRSCSRREQPFLSVFSLSLSHNSRGVDLR